VPDDLTPDPRAGQPVDDLNEVEAILSQLDLDDLEPVEPPASVWAGIEASLAVPPADVVTIDKNRRRWQAPALAVAAATLVIVGAAAIFWPDGSDTTTVAPATLTFDASNFDPLGADATAEVSLRETEEGYEIDHDEASLPGDLDEPADLEIWMIEADGDGNVVDIVALGLVDPDDPTSFTLPDDVDPARFSVVDISIEPRDGDDTHSGRSILRGQLVEIA
jgi:hypothetical protein